jgi:hypothetical protein
MTSTAIRHSVRLAAGLAAAGVLTLAPAAHADAPVGEGGHYHHVTTGNGSCQSVGAVAFLAQDRGLHQGANASGRDRGPWHGSC